MCSGVILENSCSNNFAIDSYRPMKCLNTLRTGGVILIVKNPVTGVFNNFNPLNAELNPI